MLVPVAVYILKQLVSGDVLAPPHDLRQTPIVGIDGVLHAALALELERDGRSFHLDMLPRIVVRP